MNGLPYDGAWNAIGAVVFDIILILNIHVGVCGDGRGVRIAVKQRLTFRGSKIISGHLHCRYYYPFLHTSRLINS